MRQAVTIAVLAVAMAGVGAGVLYGYDALRADVLADGITIAGVDVGGMTAAKARRTLRERVGAPLERPLTLTDGARRFVVDPKEIGLRTNVAVLLETALSESRKGTFLSRSVRNLVGRRSETALVLRVSYSREALGRVVAAARRALEQPARDAQGRVSFSGVRITPARAGVAVPTSALRGALVDRLARPDGSRTVRVAARPVEPAVTTEDLRSRFRRLITISRRRMKLRLFADGELVKTYRVGIGRAGFETPAGEYEIETMAANPAWYVPNRSWAGHLAGTVVPAGDPRNPLKARWMGFWNGAGIHGTADEASIGTAASHGCIRMTVRDIIELYSRVSLRTPLYIE